MSECFWGLQNPQLAAVSSRGWLLRPTNQISFLSQRPPRRLYTSCLCWTKTTVFLVISQEPMKQSKFISFFQIKSPSGQCFCSLLRCGIELVGRIKQMNSIRISSLHGKVWVWSKQRCTFTVLVAFLSIWHGGPEGQIPSNPLTQKHIKNHNRLKKKQLIIKPNINFRKTKKQNVFPKR